MKLKKYRVEFALSGKYPAGSIKITVTKSANDLEMAVIEAGRELIGKGQLPTLVSVWEVK